MRKYKRDILEGSLLKTTISNVHEHLNEEVKIGAWLSNKRSSGKIAFLQLRDGTGFIQGVVVKAAVSEETFNLAKSITQESSVYVTGTIVEDTRSPFGYEMQVTDLELIHESVDFRSHQKSMAPNF